MERELIEKLEMKISNIEEYINKLKNENLKYKNRVEELEDGSRKYLEDKSNLKDRLSALLQKLEQVGLE
ncbi:hypothetical protein KAU43_03115 [candidate division WOR-3 bacterium]|jgi:FtsZ-binding cell division protein ZapB|nr:hypothetical protein [candidate division WOR-3 bacterium]